MRNGRCPTRARKQADRLGRFLAGRGLQPGRDHHLAQGPRRPDGRDRRRSISDATVAVDDRLAGSLDLGTLEALLADAGDPARPVVVGHDPDFSDLLAELCGASSLPMRKGALARIDIERPLRAGTGTLRWLVPPDLLKPGR